MRRIVNYAIRLYQLARILLYGAFSTGHHRGCARRLQPVLILGKGLVTFDRDVTLGYFPSPHFINGHIYLEARSERSSIAIGKGSYINNNFVAIAEYTSIKIGERCLIGTGVEIIDSNFHGTAVSERNTSNPENAEPVEIGDDVFIGSNVRIMKGVVVGNGSIISNSSIVCDSIPSGVIATGNPARVLKAIHE